MSDTTTAIREALKTFPLDASTSVSDPPRPGDIYAPPRHSSALDPNRTLVVGNRGAGKTFWSAAYLHPDTRALMADAYPSLHLASIVEVSPGFTGEEGGTAPSPRRLAAMLSQGIDAKDIWRAVILSGTLRAVGIAVVSNLEELASKMSDVEHSENMFRKVNEQLRESAGQVVIVFDGLDRLASDWQAVRLLLGSLMQVLLEIRPYRWLKPKVFLRPDQYEDDQVFGFVDASKLKADAVRLDWKAVDLYGLLFTLLARSKAYPAFNELAKLASAAIPDGFANRPIVLPEALRRDPPTQERVFERLAGPYMGADPRRGRTYTWMPNHLADAKSEVSPRSFLNALRTAADQTSFRARTPIDATSIRAGVRSASKVRLEQLSESYRWAGMALEPLSDLKVPCQANEFIDRWIKADTAPTIMRAAEHGRYLGPVEFEGKDYPLEVLLLQALIRLGVVQSRPDGRINMPDIYRVAAQLLRKGGLTPQEPL